MGQPSLSIYVNELFNFYGVQKAIRIGTIGSIQKELKCRDIILANAACSDFSLVCNAYKKAKGLNMKTSVGPVVSSDLFYDDNQNWKLWAEYGVLGCEMESAELFTLAAKYSRKALSIFTVSDEILTGKKTSPEERQSSFKDMMILALETIIMD